MINHLIQNHLKTTDIYITNNMNTKKQQLNPHGWKYIKLVANNKNPAESWGGKKQLNKKYVYTDTTPKFKNWGVLTV